MALTTGEWMFTLFTATKGKWLILGLLRKQGKETCNTRKSMPTGPSTYLHLWIKNYQFTDNNPTAIWCHSIRFNIPLGQKSSPYHHKYICLLSNIYIKQFLMLAPTLRWKKPQLKFSDSMLTFVFTWIASIKILSFSKLHMIHHLNTLFSVVTHYFI